MKYSVPARFVFLVVAYISVLLNAPAQTVAHRGVFAIQGHETAENTISAIKNAYDRGYRKVEIDVRATSDGQGVLMHDNCPNSAATGCFGPGRTTNDDNNGGTYSPLYAPDGGIKGHEYRTPQGRTYQQMVANYRFHKVYDQAGNILFITTQPGVSHGWGLDDLIWYKQNSGDSDAYKVRSMVIVFDIQSPQALAAAQASVGRYNAWSSVEFKCWPTAFPVDNSGNLQGTYYGGFALSLNPFTILLTNDGSSVASVKVSYPGGPNWIDDRVGYSALLTSLQKHASIDTYESFIAGDGNWNAQDTLIKNYFAGNRNGYRYGVNRNPDIIIGSSGYSVNTDTLNVIDYKVLENQQSFGKDHAEPITDILN